MIRHDIADLDPSTGEFVRTRAKMMIPADGGKKVYFCNEGNNIHLGKPIKDSVESFKGASAARYVGSIVADIHRPLLYGGIYLYPTDSKSPKRLSVAPPPSLAQLLPSLFAWPLPPPPASPVPLLPRDPPPSRCLLLRRRGY